MARSLLSPTILTAMVALCWCDAPPSAGSPAATIVPAPTTTPRPAGCFDRASEVPGIEVTDPRLGDGYVVVVRKEARRIQLFHQGLAIVDKNGFVCYTIGLGFAPQGHKERQGDGKTPEGWYRTSDKPWSSFYHAIAVHYPNTDDAHAGQAAGLISRTTEQAIARATQAHEKPPQETALGGEILVHGGGSTSDWTLGCIALDNADLDYLRAKLPSHMKFWIRVLP